MSAISKIKAREILDSRGKPTIEVEVELKSGAIAGASVPSGASKGEREALELRDGDKKRFNGDGVLKAINNVLNIISPEILDIDPSNQEKLDDKLCQLDKSPNKSNLGANAILGVSLACVRAVSNEKKIPLYAYIAQIAGTKGNLLPVPMFNILNGGQHADNNIDFQEFMIAPVGAPSFKEAVRMGAEVYQCLKKILKGNGLGTAVGDEGGFAPNLKANEEAVEYILRAIKEVGLKSGKDIVLCLDPAASSFFDEKENKYIFSKSKGKSLNPDEMVSLWGKWVKDYPSIWSIEDGIAEKDKYGWKKITNELGSKIQLVGDDVFVTNPEIIRNGIKDGIANATLIKLNQIGTITETLKAMKISREAKYGLVISHRSGETTDDLIADFAVGTCAGQIKTGAPCRGERVAKYNRLMKIEEELGPSAIYAGVAFSKAGKFIQ